MDPVVFILIDFGDKTKDSVKQVVGKYLTKINKSEFVRIIRYIPKEQFDEASSSLLKELNLDDQFVLGTDFTVCSHGKIFHGRKLSNLVSGLEMSYFK